MKEPPSKNSLREKLKEEVCAVRDLLLAGEKFLREKINHY
jgi:hypothetical protein